MTSVLQDNWKYVGGALLIHVLLAVLVVGMALGSRQTVVPQLAIRAVMVDRATLNRLAQQQAPVQPQPAPTAEDEQRKQQEEAAKQQELKRQQEQAEQEKLAQAKQQQEKLKEQQRQDQLRLEAEAKQKAFQDQQRAQEAQKQQALQRQAAEAEAKRQQQAAEQKRIADIQQKQREAEQKRQADVDAKAQAAREAELKQQLEMEEGRAQAVNSGALNQWVLLISQQVNRNWLKPQSAKAGLECEVKVVQAPGGTVLSVQVGRCNGDQAVQQSIETAVYRSSPLPAPPDPRVFDRNLTFIFKPTE